MAEIVKKKFNQTSKGRSVQQCVFEILYSGICNVYWLQRSAKTNNPDYCSIQTEQFRFKFVTI